MAYGDWKLEVDFVDNAQTGSFENGTLSRGADGAARQHSSLSNPLTGSGDFCREYHAATTGAVRTVYTVSSSVSGGLFTEVPNTKAISIRANLRMSNTFPSTGDSIGIVAKANPPLNSSAGNSPVGYSVHLGRTNNGSNGDRLYFVAYDGTNTLNVQSSNFDSSFTVSDNTWYHVRMDVTPVGTLQDRIEIYTGSAPEGGSWDLVHTQIILNTDSYFIPWAEAGAGQIGFQAAVATFSSVFSYIDNFEAYVVDV